jgi:sec-independent protein translocase protein TatC
MIDATMPLTAHLEELRWRLIKALAAIVVAFPLCYAVSDQLFAFITRPLLELGNEHLLLIGTGVTEAFFTRLKVTIVAALFLSSPIIFYQLWRFIAPGLYDQEKRTAIPFVIAATVFFFAGASFCQLVVFPVAFSFFLEEYQSIGVSPSIRISEYLSFASRMLLAFGVTFEMPVLTFFLARIGLVNHRMLLRWFRYAIVVIFIVAAVLTPGPDVASQMLMAAPLLVLYVLSIGVAYLVARPAVVEATEELATPDDGAASPQ